MSVNNDPPSSIGDSGQKLSLRRLAPLMLLGCLSIVVLLIAWKWQISLATLARHIETLRNFVAEHEATALIGYVAFYIAVVALSLPAGAYLTMIGGFLFGTLLGGLAAVVAASIGAILIFSIAKSALGEHLVRKAGPMAEKIARGFRKNAFSYLLFLRLMPVFPFWLVNLVSAVSGLPLSTFAVGTVIGIVPITFAFAFVGSGLQSIMSADASAHASWKLIAALALLGLLALVPLLVKRWRKY